MAFAEDYVDVAARIKEFHEKHPEGSLQCISIEFRDGGVIYQAAAYRHPDDPRPGIGTAWEPIPGKTPYTRDSELMVCETSAWGRAIIAADGSIVTKRIASKQEVQNRQPAKQEPKSDITNW